MNSVLTPARVLGTAEARRQLPAILEEFREHGDTASPVFVGSYRRPDAVIISAALAERLAPFLEDLLLADRIRARLANEVRRLTGDDVVSGLGITEEAVNEAAVELLAQYGTHTQQ